MYKEETSTSLGRIMCRLGAEMIRIRRYDKKIGGGDDI